jgi:hypothetical protein
MAARRGVRVCVNYIMTERALELRERSIYAAYELACMRPLAGDRVYRRMRAANAWSAAFLPNAGEHEVAAALPAAARGWVARTGEALLSSSLGAGLERLEMRYRMRKMRRWLASEPDLREAEFTADWFKSHTTARAHSTVAAFAERLRQVQIAAS